MDSNAASEAMHRARKLNGYGSKCTTLKQSNVLTTTQPANQTTWPAMKKGLAATSAIRSLMQTTVDRCRRNSCSSSAIDSMFCLTLSGIGGLIAGILRPGNNWSVRRYFSQRLRLRETTEVTHFYAETMADVAI